MTLLGPPPETFIAPISRADYLAAVYALARNWPEWIERPSLLKGLSYGIPSMCCAACALSTGKHPSKQRAAEWARQQWTQWSLLIGDALRRRSARDDELGDPAATLPQARQFIAFALDQCERLRGLGGGDEVRA